jgi:hypothetical protein
MKTKGNKDVPHNLCLQNIDYEKVNAKPVNILKKTLYLSNGINIHTNHP